MGSALLAFALSTGKVSAVTVVLDDAPPTEISLRVGSEGAVVDTVAFDIDGNIAGSGVRVEGTPDIFVEVFARVGERGGGGGGRGRPGGGGGGGAATNRSFVLSVDSSIPLMNANGLIIPMTEIGWTSSDEDIPSGRFDGTPDQLLLQFDASRQIFNTHRFYFQNRGIFEPGTYLGTVTYTLAAP